MNQSPMKSGGQHESPAERRGVLLLVVLSMLTLFLMLGAAYVVTATRSREAARAYARLTFGSDDARVPHARLLDAVLLSVVRGPVVVGSGTFESLLLDKYGPGTVSGTATGSTVVNGHVATMTLTTADPIRPAALNGRILTFVQPGRKVTSHRIIRARNSANSNAASNVFTVAIDLPADKGPYDVSGSQAVIINGREYSGAPGEPHEAWDGFDPANPFLARVAPAVISGTTLVSSSTVARFSYSSAAGSDSYDNDNDGVADGRFMQFRVLPTTVTDAFGNAVTLEASVLIVDLDGRYNVNAHGSLVPSFYPPSHGGWPTRTELAISGTLDQVPLGSGYGPGELHANLGTGINPTSPNPVTESSGSTPFQASQRVFDAPYLAVGTGTSTVAGTANASQSENPRFLLMTGGGTFSSSGTIPMPRGRKPPGSRHPRFFNNAMTDPVNTPRLRFSEGRYGDVAAINWPGPASRPSLATDTNVGKPGAPQADDEASMIGDRRVADVANTGTNYGIPAIWWDGSANYDWSLSSLTSGPRGVFNSPPDLHGRMKTLTLAGSGSAMVPRMVFAQPEWTHGAAMDDPYEFRLDARRGFGGMLHNPDPATGAAVDNPFTLAELDAVLRPYDIDTFRRPSRLVAALGSTAEESRLKVTTDSWDTTAITGSAAIAIFGTNGWLSQVPATARLYDSDPTSGVIGGEVSRGERFDLNRALGTGVTGTSDPNSLTQRRAYFKDLYTLLFSLAEGSGQTVSAADAAAYAQWAANVVEFRDGDSMVTPFEYDINPRDGWGVTGDITDANDATPAQRAVVWGAERPEIVIADTLAWENVDSGTTGGLFIALHRPWNAKAHAKNSGAATEIPAEPCDLAFDTRTSGSTGRPRNEVDLGKKAGVAARSGTNPLYDDVSSTTWPIWRLRIVGGGTTEYVRLDMGTNATAGTTGRAFGVEALSTSGSLGDKKPKLAADSTLTLRGSTALRWATSSTTGTLTVTSSGSSCAISGASGSLRVPGTVVTGSASRTAVIHLERLADPTGTASQQVWDADQSPLATGTGTLAQRYLVVDSSTVTVWNTGTTGRPGVTSHTLRGTRRAVGVAQQAFWRPPSEDSGTITISPPAAPVPASPSFPNLVTGASATNVAWFPWPNRPFASAAELLLVPQGSAVEILQNYRRLTPAASGSIGLGQGVPVPLALLFDAVHVPTRFTGIHASGAGSLGANIDVGLHAVFTANQVSAFREPGRVNLNTVTGSDVWNTVVGGPLEAAVVSGMSARLGMFPPGASPAVLTPAGSLFDILRAVNPAGGTVVSDTSTLVGGNQAPMPTGVLAWDVNPMHALYTATRLANTTTPRSNLFAIWITLRESVSGDPDSVRFRRGFYIVDRSIPVGFSEGRDLNVWDAVRLRRIIE